MAKRKTTKKRGQTKKDLEKKIKALEAKVAGLSTQTKPAEIKTPPPPPKPAETKPAETKPAETKPAETQTPPSPPKPAEKAAPPVTLSESLENAWQNYPMTNTFDYKKKTPGYTPNPNRYFGRLIATVGTTQTYDWNLQKAKVPGYTAPSNQYFATRARLSYHPADTNFTGYGLQVEGATAQAQTQTAPPPPPPPPQPEPQQTTASAGESSRKSELEKYEEEYLARLDNEARENDELMKAAEELAAKRASESGGSSGQSSSTKGSLPKGF